MYFIYVLLLITILLYNNLQFITINYLLIVLNCCGAFEQVLFIQISLYNSPSYFAVSLIPHAFDPDSDLHKCISLFTCISFIISFL